MRIRHKGVALVETDKGILVVAGRRKIYSLPGGGANRGESRKKATIRELREETGLKSKGAKYLFSYKGRKWKVRKGNLVKNHAKVFLIKTYGRARPRHEIKYIAWWKLGSKLKISTRAESIIKKYMEMKK